MPAEPPGFEQDEAAVIAAEGEGMVEVEQASTDQIAQQAPQTLVLSSEEFLEETALPTTVENHDLEAGSQVSWGALSFSVDRPYLGGWYEAHQGDTALLVKPQMDGSLLASLGQHRLLPKVLYAGQEGTAVAGGEGQAVGQRLSLTEALDVVQPLAQFVYFLELKGLTLVDLEPRSLVLSDEGLRLVVPPYLAPIGQVAQPRWRDGHTPPEVVAEQVLSSKSGVYLIGALLFELLSGNSLPVEGPSNLLLSGVSLPGVPQVLAQLLGFLEERSSPQEAIALLKSLRPAARSVLEVGAATSIGLNPTRPYNEDAYGYRFEQIQSQWNQTLLLRACVSDGMGGMAAGERASQAAVESFLAPPPPHPLDDPQAQADWAIRLVWESNQAVLEALAGKDGGCTLSGLLFVGMRYVLAHVGDTRIYLWSQQGLQQITQDHSLVAALLASGMITPEEALNHPDRNKVLRSLGNLRQPQDDYVQSLQTTFGNPAKTLEVGELLLLVSDGVWGEVVNSQITEILSQVHQPYAIADALVEAALKAGAPDNVTALVVYRSS